MIVLILSVKMLNVGMLNVGILSVINAGRHVFLLLSVVNLNVIVLID